MGFGSYGKIFCQRHIPPIENSLVYSLSYNFNYLLGKVVSLYMVEEGRYFDFLFTNYTNNGAMGFYYAEVGGISPNEGEILPGEAEVVELSLSAEGLDAGVHYQEFTLFHNGLAPSKKLVGKITVLGAPALSVAEESLAFGISPIGDKSYQEISITNSGSASGVISLASDHPAFTVDSESVRIKANETKTVAVAFNPPSSGDFSGLITITTDDAANPSFCGGRFRIRGYCSYHIRSETQPQCFTVFGRNDYAIIHNL